MKKVLAKGIALITAVGCCLSMGLAGCGGKGGGGSSSPFTSVKDVYGFGAATSCGILAGYASALAATPTAFAVAQTPTTDEAAIAETLDRYLPVIEGIVGNEKPIDNTIEASDRAEYAVKMTSVLTNLDGTRQEYVFYYNETVPGDNNRPADDDDEDEIETALNGVMVFKNAEYAIVGEKEAEAGETEVKLRARLDADTELRFQQETELDEQSFKYAIYVGGVLTEENEIEIETENGETEAEFTTSINGTRRVFKIEQKTENGQNLLEISDRTGETVTKFEVTIEQRDGKNYYKFRFADAEIETERDDD